MKYGFCSWSISHDLPNAMRLSKDMEADCISLDFSAKESHFPLCDPQLQKEIIMLSQELSMELCCLGVNALCTQSMGSIQHERAVHDIINYALETAAALNIPAMHLPSFGKSMINSPEEFEQTAKFLSYSCEKAKDYGILLGHESIFSVEQNRKMQEMVNMDNLFLYFDGGNLIASGNEDPERLIREMHTSIKQLHIKDVHRGDPEHRALGNGEARVKQTVKTLVQYGYDGCWLIEENYINRLHQAPVDLQNLRSWIEA